MAYSAQTTNYGLPLPTGTDKSTWLDTNEGFQAVDTALAGAVAKGSSNEGAIEALATRMLAAEGGITQNATDIDALETRMTANEQVAGNALTGVAQLSEKVYEYEERTFTSAAELFAFIDALSAEKQRLLNVKSISLGTGTRKRVDIKSTISTSEFALSAETFNELLRLEDLSATRIWFTGNYTEANVTVQYTLHITTSNFDFNRISSAVQIGSTPGVTYDVDTCSVTDVTLIIPVAVADD